VVGFQVREVASTVVQFAKKRKENGIRDRGLPILVRRLDFVDAVLEIDDEFVELPEIAKIDLF
jgi:hypothetical protein